MATNRADYRYIVKEYEDGTPWICCELMRGDDLPLPRNAFLGFDLKKGTTYEKDKEIARFMEENIEVMSMTTL